MSSIWSSIRNRKESEVSVETDGGKPPSGRSSVSKASRTTSQSRKKKSVEDGKDGQETCKKGRFNMASFKEQILPRRPFGKKNPKEDRSASANKFTISTETPPTPLPTPEPELQESDKPPVPESPKPKLRGFKNRAASVSPSRLADVKRRVLRGISKERIIAPLPAPIKKFLRPRSASLNPPKSPPKPNRRPGPVGKVWVKAYPDITYMDDTSEEFQPVIAYSGHPQKIPEANPLPIPPTPPPENKIKTTDTEKDLNAPQESEKEPDEKVILDEVKKQENSEKLQGITSSQTVEEITEITEFSDDPRLTEEEIQDIERKYLDEEIQIGFTYEAEKCSIICDDDDEEVKKLEKQIEEDSENKKGKTVIELNIEETKYILNEAKNDKPSKSKKTKIKFKKGKRQSTPVREVSLPLPEEENISLTKTPTGEDNVSEDIMEDGYIIPQTLKHPQKPIRGNKIYEKISLKNISSCDKTKEDTNATEDVVISETVTTKICASSQDTMIFTSSEETTIKNIKIESKEFEKNQRIEIKAENTESVEIKDKIEEKCHIMAQESSPNSNNIGIIKTADSKQDLNEKQAAIDYESESKLEKSLKDYKQEKLSKTFNETNSTNSPVPNEIANGTETPVKPKRRLKMYENIELQQNDETQQQPAQISHENQSEPIKPSREKLKSSMSEVYVKNETTEAVINSNIFCDQTISKDDENKENINLVHPSAYAKVCKDRTSKEMKEIDLSFQGDSPPPPIPPKKKDIKAINSYYDKSTLIPPRPPRNKASRSADASPQRSRKQRIVEINEYSLPASAIRSTKVYTELRILPLQEVTSTIPSQNKASCPSKSSFSSRPLPAPPRHKKSPGFKKKMDHDSQKIDSNNDSNLKGKVMQKSFTPLKRTRPLPPLPPPSPSHTNTDKAEESNKQHVLNKISNNYDTPSNIISDANLNAEIDKNLKNIDQSFNTLDSVIESLKKYATLPASWSYDTKRRVSCDVVCKTDQEVVQNKKHTVININMCDLAPNDKSTSLQEQLNHFHTKISQDTHKYIPSNETKNFEPDKSNIEFDLSGDKHKFKVSDTSLSFIKQSLDTKDDEISNEKLACQVKIEPIDIISGNKNLYLYDQESSENINAGYFATNKIDISSKQDNTLKKEANNDDEFESTDDKQLENISDESFEHTDEDNVVVGTLLLGKPELTKSDDYHSKIKGPEPNLNTKLNKSTVVNPENHSTGSNTQPKETVIPINLSDSTEQEEYPVDNKFVKFFQQSLQSHSPIESKRGKNEVLDDLSFAVNRMLETKLPSSSSSSPRTSQSVEMDFSAEDQSQPKELKPDMEELDSIIKEFKSKEVQDDELKTALDKSDLMERSIDDEDSSEEFSQHSVGSACTVEEIPLPSLSTSYQEKFPQIPYKLEKFGEGEFHQKNQLQSLSERIQIIDENTHRSHSNNVDKAVEQIVVVSKETLNINDLPINSSSQTLKTIPEPTLTSGTRPKQASISKELSNQELPCEIINIEKFPENSSKSCANECKQTLNTLENFTNKEDEICSEERTFIISQKDDEKCENSILVTNNKDLMVNRLKETSIELSSVSLVRNVEMNIPSNSTSDSFDDAINKEILPEHNDRHIDSSISKEDSSDSNTLYDSKIPLSSLIVNVYQDLCHFNEKRTSIEGIHVQQNVSQLQNKNTSEKVEGNILLSLASNQSIKSKDAKFDLQDSEIESVLSVDKKTSKEQADNNEDSVQEMIPLEDDITEEKCSSEVQNQLDSTKKINITKIIEGATSITEVIEGVPSQVEDYMARHIPLFEVSDSSNYSPSSSSNRSSIDADMYETGSNTTFYSLENPNSSNYSLLSYYTARSPTASDMSTISLTNTASARSSYMDGDDELTTSGEELDDSTTK